MKPETCRKCGRLVDHGKAGPGLVSCCAYCGAALTEPEIPVNILGGAVLREEARNAAAAAFEYE